MSSMPRDVTVFFIHGINVRALDFAQLMRAKILKRLPKTLRKYAGFQTIFWADIVRARSQRFFDQAVADAGISNSVYRRMVVEGLGDAAAYQKTRKVEDSAYYAIQSRVRQIIKDAAAREDPHRPIVFVAHSLGCHILSSYAWDTNRLKQLSDQELTEWDEPVTAAIANDLRTATPFERLDTFAGFVTLGCNMPLFTFTFGPDRVMPITRYTTSKRAPAFPGAKLDDATKTQAKWLNFFSKSDLLGYPLKSLSKAYGEEPCLHDQAVKSEGLIRAALLPKLWNAYAAHIGYWKNATVVRHTAELIQNIIEPTSAR
jgi:hypothetical protein